jgi:SAM-dependent methyltransferase
MKRSRRASASEPVRDEKLTRTLALIGSFYGARKVGYQGNEGYRKSTDLGKLVPCVEDLVAKGFLDPARTVFADLGCGDGRVNVLMSYFVRRSIGVEIDPDILSEYEPRKRALLQEIEEADLRPPPENVCLFSGSSLDDSLYERVHGETGFRFEDMDLFYTYITLHDVFAEKIRRDAREGALYLVYGFHKVLPAYPGLEVMIPDVAGQQIAALFVKGSPGG